MGMRRLVAGALLGLALVSTALSQDAPAGKPNASNDAQRLLSVTEWNDELKKLNRTDLSPADLLAKRRELAQSCRIVREGTIVAIDRRTGRIDVQSLRFADEITPLRVTSADDLAGLSAWNVGDAVSWLDRPVVREDGSIDFVSGFSKLSDLTHYVPPVVEPKSLTESAKKQLTEQKRSSSGRVYGDSSEFKMWLIVFAEALPAADSEITAVTQQRWRSAWLVYCVSGLWRKTWRMPAHVSEIENDAVVVAFEEMRPYYQNWQGPAVRFGIGANDRNDGYLRRRIEVEPKRAKELKARDEVTVALEVEGAGIVSLEEMRSSGGAFKMRFAILDSDEQKTSQAQGPSVAPKGERVEDDDKPAQAPPPMQSPPPKGATLKLDQLEALIERVRSLDTTTAEKVQGYRALHSRGYLIAVKGVLDDIVPVNVQARVWVDTRPGYGYWTERQVETMRLDLSGDFPPDRFGDRRSWGRQFTIPWTERDKVAKWRKGDVVSWRERAWISDDGRVACVPVFERLADIKRETPKSPPR